jgi:hypothetical protein
MNSTILLIIGTVTSACCTEPSGVACQHHHTWRHSHMPGLDDIRWPAGASLSAQCNLQYILLLAWGIDWRFASTCSLNTLAYFVVLCGCPPSVLLPYNYRVSDGWIFTSYKGVHKRCFDGGFSNLCPVPPAPPPPSPPPVLPNQQQHDRLLSSHVSHSSASHSSASHSNEHAAEATGEVVPAMLCPADAGSASTLGLFEAPLLLVNNTQGISTKLGPTGVHDGTRATKVISHTQHLQRHLSWRRHRSSNTKLDSASPGAAASDGVGHKTGLSDLAARCLVAGAGSYVAAPGWFAVRVCVLPSKHAHAFPAMFRVGGAVISQWPRHISAQGPQGDHVAWLAHTSAAEQE